METYLNALKKEGYLTDNAYNLGMENIEKLNLMEMYYALSTRDIPLIQQSILNNISYLILGGSELKSTVVRPELKDDLEAKKRKKNFFESQLINLFGKDNTNNKEIENKGQLNEIKEIEEDDIKNSKIDDIKKMKNKLGIDEIPETEVKYKNDINNNINDKK